MGTLALNVHSTKLLYATILKGLALWRQIRARRDMLAGMLPSVSTQWDILQKVIMPCISRKVAITASLSKADTVPDETRVPPSVEINPGVVRLMLGLATSLGLTLSANYEWNDEANNYRQAIENFATIANILIEIEQIAADLCMHRAYAADLYDDQNELRTPGQLAFYTECDVPLADGIFVSQFNRFGMISGFGALYLGWMLLSIEDLVTGTPPTIQISQIDVTATPADDPENPGTYTLYHFAATAGWSLAGAVVAARPSLDAPVAFFSSGAEYTSGSAGYLKIGGSYTNPAMPPVIAFKLLLIRSV